ncbi:transglycosylase SLT domain-containing protein [Microvirga aerilata]|uniref:Transglycosylase SLT domain-containing protein n=2 Tax=Microvirga aerilata TaxID=670292 RepID=A0A936Z9W8_9HYPH|nr:transglycosylase SLT domain-containing protein [Microvirga aerilata]
MHAGSSSAHPDFNVDEIDVDQQLAFLPLPPEPEFIETSAILDVDARSNALKDRSTYLPSITHEAAANGIPPALVDAVVRIESRYDPAAIGSVGEIGLMQVRPKTAELLGFQGTSAELAQPQTNLRYGVGYLAKAWRLASGDLCRTLMKYRAGHGSETMSALSVEYCRRARLHLASVGINYAALVAAPAHASKEVRKDGVQRSRSVMRTASATRGPRFHLSRSKWKPSIRVASRVRKTATRAEISIQRRPRSIRLVRQALTRTAHHAPRVLRRWVASR